MTRQTRIQAVPIWLLILTLAIPPNSAHALRALNAERTGLEEEMSRALLSAGLEKRSWQGGPTVALHVFPRYSTDVDRLFFNGFNQEGDIVRIRVPRDTPEGPRRDGNLFRLNFQIFDSGREVIPPESLILLTESELRSLLQAQLPSDRFEKIWLTRKIPFRPYRGRERIVTRSMPDFRQPEVGSILTDPQVLRGLIPYRQEVISQAARSRQVTAEPFEQTHPFRSEGGDYVLVFIAKGEDPARWFPVAQVMVLPRQWVRDSPKIKVGLRTYGDFPVIRGSEGQPWGSLLPVLTTSTAGLEERVSSRKRGFTFENVGFSDSWSEALQQRGIDRPRVLRTKSPEELLKLGFSLSQVKYIYRRMRESPYFGMRQVPPRPRRYRSSIVSLGLTPHTLSILRDNGVFTVKELLATPEENIRDFTRLPSGLTRIGERGMRDIKAGLAARGLRLRSGEEIARGVSPKPAAGLEAVAVATPVEPAASLASDLQNFFAEQRLTAVPVSRESLTIVDLTMPAGVLLASELPPGVIGIIRREDYATVLQVVPPDRSLPMLQEQLFFLEDHADFAEAVLSIVSREASDLLEELRIITGRSGEELSQLVQRLSGRGLELHLVRVESPLDILRLLWLDDQARSGLEELLRGAQDNWAALADYL